MMNLDRARDLLDMVVDYADGRGFGLLKVNMLTVLTVWFILLIYKLEGKDLFTSGITFHSLILTIILR